MAALLLLLPQASAYPGNFALQFLAKDGDVLRVPHESSMQGPLIDSFTVELWLKVDPNSQLDSGRIVNLIGFPGRHPFLGLAADTGCATIQLKTDNGAWYSYEGTTPIDDGLWHHVAATWDGTSLEPTENQLALYVDGMLESAGGEDDDATDVPKTPEAFGVKVVNRCETGLCEEGMQIGGLYCCSGEGYSGRYLNGTLDEIRVWKAARTQSQIESLLHAPLAAGDYPDLLFYFPLDEAGMELGANVVESRALPWYGILGNAKGTGRPHWVVSHAPLSCSSDSRAPICRRLHVTGESIGGNSLYNDEDDESVSPAALLSYMLLTACASALCGAFMTYTHVTGSYPPHVTALLTPCLGRLRGLASGAAGYMPAASGPSGGQVEKMPPAPDQDWKWAQPPRASQQALPRTTNATPPAAGPPPAAPNSYGGL